MMEYAHTIRIESPPKLPVLLTVKGIPLELPDMVSVNGGYVTFHVDARDPRSQGRSRSDASADRDMYGRAWLQGGGNEVEWTTNDW
jgi:hypothetical protein